MHLFWDAIQDMGGKIAAIESYDPELTDFAVPIKKLVGLYYKVPKDLEIELEIIPEEESPWWLNTYNPRAMIPYFPNELKIVKELYVTIQDKAPGPVATEADRGRGEEEVLRSCYRKSLALALENGVRRIAFPAISTGVYGYPKEAAAAVALDVMRSAEGPDEIIACCFSRQDAETYLRLCPECQEANSAPPPTGR